MREDASRMMGGYYASIRIMAKAATELEIQDIIQMYYDGLSSEVISQKTGRKAQTITRYLRDRGIEIRGPKTKLTEADRQEMCRLYSEEKLSCPKIAERFEVSDALVLRYLKKYEVEIRSAEEAHRKYPINEEFFDNIDSEEKAYFLGFLYADGCNHQDANYVSLGLEETDREILLKLSTLIYKENPEFHVKIQDRTSEGKGVTVCLTINSKHICNKLSELGCVQAKTHVLIYPEWMREDLHRHFLRGYFDGDGCLYVNKRIREGSYVKLTSTLDFCQYASKIVQDHIPINLGIYGCSGTTVFDLKTSGDRQVEKLMTWLYAESHLYMQRKFLAYQNLLEEISKTNSLIEKGTRGYRKQILK